MNTLSALFILLLFCVLFIISLNISINIHIRGGQEKNNSGKKIIIPSNEYTHIIQGLKNRYVCKNKFKVGDRATLTNNVESRDVEIIDVSRYDSPEKCLYVEGYKNIYPDAPNYAQAMDKLPKKDINVVKFRLIV